MKTYKLVDYQSKYKGVMVFNKNMNENIHRWYPFVEGFSKTFIQDILKEINYKPQHCLEPFSGSGTTGLELQNYDIKCSSFEVSPFMHLLSKVKMRTDYTPQSYRRNCDQLIDLISNSPNEIFKYIMPPIKSKITSYENNENRVNYNRSVMEGICDIKYAISKITDRKYKELYLIVLASILPDVGNLYRNGKCMSYKKIFPNFVRQDVHNLFINRLNNEIDEDIKYLDKLKQKKSINSNWKNLHFGDVRKNITKLDDDACDLIITSPPYLNSRDYTDTYMMELWILDLVKNYKDVRQLRKQTIRSHVQIKWETQAVVNSQLLIEVMDKIYSKKEEFWNDSIPDMILAYFNDIDFLFREFFRILKKDSYIYWNVANSAYFGTEIPTDLITAQIAENRGFEIIEIRDARKVKTSSQQKDSIGKLRESVTIMKKK